MGLRAMLNNCFIDRHDISPFITVIPFFELAKVILVEIQEPV